MSHFVFRVEELNTQLQDKETQEATYNEKVTEKEKEVEVNAPAILSQYVLCIVTMHDAF